MKIFLTPNIINKSFNKISIPIEPTFSGRKKTDGVDEKNTKKIIVRERKNGKTIKAISDMLNLSKTHIRYSYLVEEAKRMKQEGNLPPKFEQLADEYINVFEIPPKKKNKVIEIFVKMPELIGYDIKKIGKNIEIGANLLNIEKKDYIKTAMLYPRLFLTNPKIYKKNFEKCEKIFDVSQKDFVNAALKHPQIFIQKPETLSKNVDKNVELLGIDRKTFINAALRFPQLFCQKPETLHENVVKSSAMLGIDKKLYIKACLRQPTMISLKADYLKANIQRNAKVLGCTKEEFVKMALQQPPLFCLKSETLKSNIKKSAKILDMREKDYLKVASKQANILAYKPETLKNNIEKSTKLFGMTKEEFISKIAKQPYLIVVKPETIYDNAELHKYTVIVKGKTPKSLENYMNIFSKKHHYSDILRFLICKEDKVKLPYGNRTEVVKNYLKLNPDVNYKFKIPQSKFAQELIDFAQNLSNETLGKNVFEFEIIDIEPVSALPD